MTSLTNPSLHQPTIIQCIIFYQKSALFLLQNGTVWSMGIIYYIVSEDRKSKSLYALDEQLRQTINQPQEINNVFSD